MLFYDKLLTFLNFKAGTKETFVKDLEQSWRLYQLQAFVFKLSWGHRDTIGQAVRGEMLDLIVQVYPRRVWLYVKHMRWMLSSEYAMLKETYVGTAPIFAAKTKHCLSQR